MPQKDTLELLGALVDKLEPLGAMEPGTPLRAGDWNVLIDAVRTMGRLAASRERTTDELLKTKYAPLVHEHVGQVALSWFDPQTRVLVDSAINGSVEQRTAIEALRGDIAGIRKSVAEIQSDLTSLRTEVDGLRDANSASSKNLDKVALRLEAVRELEPRVSAFTQRLDAISSDVGKALEFRGELFDDAGNPINVRAFGERISSLETMRENLLTADGSLVRIREIQSAIGRLEDRALDAGDLDLAVVDRLRDAQIIAQSGLVDAVTAQTEARFSARVGEIEQRSTQIQADIEAVRGQAAQFDTRITGQEARITRAQEQLTTLAPVADRANALGARMTDLESRTQANQTALAALAGVPARVDAATAAVNALSGIPARLTQLDGRVSNVEALRGSVDTLVTSLNQAAGRITVIEQALPDLRRTSDTVRDQGNTLRTLNDRVAANEAELTNLGQLRPRVESMTTQVAGFASFQAGTTQRLNDMASRVSTIDALTGRVGAVEQMAAESRNVIFRLDTRVNQVESRFRSSPDVILTDPGLIIRPDR